MISFSKYSYVEYLTNISTILESPTIPQHPITREMIERPAKAAKQTAGPNV